MVTVSVRDLYLMMLLMFLKNTNYTIRTRKASVDYRTVIQKIDWINYGRTLYICKRDGQNTHLVRSLFGIYEAYLDLALSLGPFK